MIVLRPRRALAWGIALLSGCLCFLPQCHLDQTSSREEKFVTVKLHDSLARYDSVKILVLADGDTGQEVGTVWNGPLRAPSAIPSFRLEDSETRTLSVRVMGFDQYGRLVLDLRIVNEGGRQVVTDIALPKPSPALVSLLLSPGTLVPPFDPAVKEYALDLANAQSTFRVKLVPAYSPATMLVGFKKAYSGQPSDPIDLHVGANRITIGVTAADTSTQYFINATRAAPPGDTTKPDSVPNPNPDPDLNALNLLLLNWKHKAVVNLDYAHMGIGTDEVVTDFPLLIRLTRSNFTLYQAGDGGRDLRFATSEGRMLPYEIGRWDAANGEADVWIKTDTLRSDGSSSPILMFWGNTAALSAADPAKVFPPKAGWTAVWHLGETSKGTTGEYKDATGRYNATGDGAGKIIPSRGDGIVGYGQNFKGPTGQGCIVIPSEFDPGDKAWTLNLWVKRQGTEQSILFNKSVGFDAATQRFQINAFEGAGQKVSLVRHDAAYKTEIYLPQDGFVLLGIVYDGTKANFYVDGYPRESNDWAQGLDPMAKTILGASDDKGTYGFHGIMDEFWASSVPRSSSFMRFMYENQKPYSPFVVLLPL
ncbi:MAG: hypothetical protein JWO30_3664 [Fibrobacteres bacterium]|nr:hypothetical protein [Fibrobacterota bacterium]